MMETFRCADCGCPDDEHNADELDGGCTRCGDCDGYVPGYTCGQWHGPGRDADSRGSGITLGDETGRVGTRCRDGLS